MRKNALSDAPSSIDVDAANRLSRLDARLQGGGDAKRDGRAALRDAAVTSPPRSPDVRVAVLVMAMMTAPLVIAEERAPRPDGPRVADWSGPYAGAYAGVGTSSGRAKLAGSHGQLIPVDVEYGLFPRGIKGNSTGGVAGIGAGYNFQSGTFVRGIEIDVGYVSTSPHHHYSRIDNVPTSPFPGVSTNTNYWTDFGFLGAVRARGGYAFGDTMVFGSIGVAAGKVHNRLELSMTEIGYTSPNWSESGIRFGYALGVGIEHRVTSRMSLKFETQYVNLADRTVRGADPVAFPGEGLNYRFSNDVIIARLGLNLKF